jgi:hypothetical protein
MWSPRGSSRENGERLVTERRRRLELGVADEPGQRGSGRVTRDGRVIPRLVADQGALGAPRVHELGAVTGEQGRDSLAVSTVCVLAARPQPDEVDEHDRPVAAFEKTAERLGRDVESHSILLSVPAA